MSIDNTSATKNIKKNKLPTISRKKIILPLALVVILGTYGIGYYSGKSGKSSNNNEVAKTQILTNPSARDYLFSINNTATDHVVLMSQVNAAVIDSAPNIDQLNRMLDKNTNAYVATIKNLYGDEASQEFSGAWKTRNDKLIQHAEAVKKQDKQAQDTIKQEITEKITPSVVTSIEKKSPHLKTASTLTAEFISMDEQIMLASIKHQAKDYEAEQGAVSAAKDTARIISSAVVEAVRKEKPEYLKST